MIRKLDHYDETERKTVLFSHIRCVITADLMRIKYTQRN